MQIYYRVKAAGRRRPVLEKAEASLPDPIRCLRDVIQAIVADEVERFNARSMEQSIFPYLTPERLEEQADTGKVGFMAAYDDRKADAGQAVKTALQAFEDGIFKVLINDEAVENLDDPLTIEPGSVLTFIRLTLLSDDALIRRGLRDMERKNVERNMALPDHLYKQIEQKKGQPYDSIAVSLLDYLEAEYQVKEERKQQLLAGLDKAYGSPVQELADAGQLLKGPLAGALLLLFGQEQGEELLDLLKRRMQYPYSMMNYYRKGYRSRNMAFYFDVLLTTIMNYYSGLAYDFTLEDYLTRQDMVLHADFIMADKIAREVDNGNAAVIEALRNIMFGENQGALLTRTMIRGIVQSHSEECYDMLGRLLIAAQLQEGLRQHIMESLDEGTVEASIYLLRIVLEHKLDRFSSVIRALDTWTGLGFSDQKPAVIRKCLELALRTLTDEAYREEAAGSRDSLEFYFSLWAAATYAVEDAVEGAAKVLNHGERYQKLAALYFLAQINVSHLQHLVAGEQLTRAADDLEQVAWILKSYYSTHQVIYNYDSGDSKRKIDLSDSPISAELNVRREQFMALMHALSQLKGPSQGFEGNSFPWSVSLTADDLLRCMMTLAAYDLDAVMIDHLIDCGSRMDIHIRHGFLVNLIGSAAEGKPREYLLSALGDKSPGNRETALKLLDSLDLTEAELDKVTALLKSKTGSIRQASIQLLLKQEDAALGKRLSVLLNASNEQQRLAGLTIAESIQQDENRAKLLETAMSLVQQLHSKGKATSQEQVLIDKLLNQDQPEYGFENGFGLYEPANQLEIPSQFDHYQLVGGQKPGATELENSYVKQLAAWDPDKLLGIYKHFESLIEHYRDYEYEAQYYSHYSEKVLMGNQNYGLSPVKVAGEGELDRDKLDSYPLPEVWRQAVRELELTPVVMAQFLYASRHFCNNNEQNEEWLTNLYADVLDKEKSNRLNNALKDFKHIRITEQLVRLLFIEGDPVQNFALCMGIYRSLRNRLTVEQCAVERMRPGNSYYYRQNDGFPALDVEYLEYWLGKAEKHTDHEEQFREYFFTSFSSYKLMKKKSAARLSVETLVKAHYLGMIGDELLLQEMFSGHFAGDLIRLLTHSQWGKQLIQQYPSVPPLVDKAVTRIVEIESSRGDLPTGVSKLAQNVNRFEGMRFFISILRGLGKETFQRGYVYGSKQTKKEVLSSLLKSCYPAPGEDANLLGELLVQSGITEQRLLEAAMYAPQWVDIVQQHLGWPGLKSAAWYFHAHINESFSAQKETEVAIYSPVSAQSFNDGAFDGEWFKSAYETLGSERFNMLYSCAKYITDGGSSHRRAQLFADAALGKLDKQVLVEEIRAARNKDKLLSYTLLPIKSGDKHEALERYEFIQRFLKESKQFGAQRRESEGKACDIALGNLARNFGYGDVNRMMWELEAEKFGEISDFFQPQEIGGANLWLEFDEEGQVELRAEKGGKLLKNVPAAIKKHEQVLLLKDMQKSLKDQHARAKQSLEQAMEKSSRFTTRELAAITRNPVVASLARHLVWVSQESGAVGYMHQPENEQAESCFALRQPDGSLTELQPDAELLLAHPVHLYASGDGAHFSAICSRGRSGSRSSRCSASITG